LIDLYKTILTEVTSEDKHSFAVRRMMKNFISIFAFQSQEVCNDMYESLRFKDEMFDDKIDATDRVVSTEVWIDIAKDPRIKAKL